MTMETKIYTKISCDNCSGTGKVPSMDESKLYDYSYCPFCKGVGTHDAWTSILEFKAMLDRL